jgi:hypothetical protein
MVISTTLKSQRTIMARINRDTIIVPLQWSFWAVGNNDPFGQPFSNYAGLLLRS